MTDKDTLIARFNDTLADDPRNVDAYLGRGTAYLDLGRYRKAIADFDRVLDLQPGNARAEENRSKAVKLTEIDKAMGSSIIRDW